MSYNKAMFHRIAEEVDRIAYDVADESGEHVSVDDICLMLNAIGILMVYEPSAWDELDNALMGALSAKNNPDMGTVFDYTNDAIDELLTLLLKRKGFTYHETTDGIVFYA